MTLCTTFDRVNRTNTRGKAYDIIPLSSDAHVNAICALEQIVYDDQPDDLKHYVATRTPGFFYDFIASKQGILIGIPNPSEPSELAAMAAIAQPRQDNTSPRYQGFDNFHWDNSVIFEGMRVHPNHRGEGLHKLLIDQREKILAHQNNQHIQYAYSKVSMGNIRSWNNLMRVGFVIAGLSPYGREYPEGLLPRFVLRQTLYAGFNENKREIVMSPPNKSTDISVHYEDIDQHKLLLDRGYWGIDVNDIHPKDPYVIYRQHTCTSLQSLHHQAL